MPVIQQETIRTRLEALLRAHPDQRFTLAKLAAELDCDLSSLPPNCRALAESEKDIWYVVSASPGVAAWVMCSKRPPKLGDSK